jgi:outer membrane murein-binding lipoprotein Lpp
VLLAALGVSALGGCSSPAASNPFASLGIENPSSAQFCQVVQDEVQKTVTEARQHINDDPRAFQSYIERTKTDTIAYEKRLLNAAPAEIHGDLEAVARQVETGDAASVNNPQLLEAAQHIMDYVNTHCPGVLAPIGIDKLSPGADSRSTTSQDAPATGEQPALGNELTPSTGGG